MSAQYLKNKFSLIEDNIMKVKSIKDPKLVSMLSGYLVVFISGIYEDCIEYLFIQRAGKNGDSEIQNLMKTFVDRYFRNPEYRKIKELLKALNPKYGKILREKIDDKNIDGINSIVTNKNNIAHGNNSNVTVEDVNIWHNNSLKVFEVLEKILLGKL